MRFTLVLVDFAELSGGRDVANRTFDASSIDDLSCILSEVCGSSVEIDSSVDTMGRPRYWVHGDLEVLFPEEVVTPDMGCRVFKVTDIKFIPSRCG